MLEVKDISKKFGSVTALKDLSFSVQRGEILGIAGLNGAGKSTLISIISGILKPDCGVVQYEGVDITRAPHNLPLTIGYVPQEIALFDGLSVRDNLNFWTAAGTRKKMRNSDDATSAPRPDRVRNALEMCALTNVFKNKLSSLSGGMKRRANIAAALVMAPDILVMDEPTSGLDVKNRKDILLFIRSLVKSSVVTNSNISSHAYKSPHTAIFTSHQSGELELICDRVILLNRGQMVFDGLFTDLPEFVRAFREIGAGGATDAGSNIFSNLDFENPTIDDILYALGSADKYNVDKLQGRN